MSSFAEMRGAGNVLAFGVFLLAAKNHDEAEDIQQNNQQPGKQH
jgi:hypothetical protein